MILGENCKAGVAAISFANGDQTADAGFSARVDATN